MWGRVLDVINYAKFQLDGFRGFGAPGGRKSLSPINWRYRSYNSVRTNVLQCDRVGVEVKLPGRVLFFSSLGRCTEKSIERGLTLNAPQKVFRS